MLPEEFLSYVEYITQNFLKTHKGKQFQESNYFGGELPQNFLTKLNMRLFLVSCTRPLYTKWFCS